MKKDPQELVDNFNDYYAVGTQVLYWPRGQYIGEPKSPVKTRGPAFVLGGHSAMIQLEGRPGSFSLLHCTPYANEEE